MHKVRKLLTILICFVFLLPVSACSNNDFKGTTNAKESFKAITYPLSFKDYYNDNIKIDKEPQRIVSVAPNITEIICSLGKVDKLVGRTDFCNYPENVKSIQSIGDIQNPNIEKILELNPDVVIASSLLTRDVSQKLKALDIKVIVIEEDKSFEGTYNTIEKVGRVINSKGKANEVVSNMQKKVNEITEKVKDRSSLNVYYVISYGKNGNYTAGKNTFISKMISMAGAKNIADDIEGWTYGVEKLVEKNPDILIYSTCMAGTSENIKKGINNTTGYKDLTAVKNNKLYDINPDILERQGPRLTEGLEVLAQIIHPEAFK